MKYYSLVIITILSLCSCTKENHENACHDPSLISHIRSGDSIFRELIYNRTCLIYESIEPFAYKKYSYNSNNRLSKLEQASLFNPALSFSCAAPSIIPGNTDPRKAKITEYSEFEYDSTGSLTKKLNYFINNGNNGLVSYQTYEYYNDQVVKLNTFNPDGKLTQYHEYEYDENGNVIVDNNYLVEDIAGAKLKRHSVYELDEKNNPYLIFAFEGIPGLFTNRNNIIKESFVNYNAGGEYEGSIQNTYEYNTSGYPVKANNLIYSYGD